MSWLNELLRGRTAEMRVVIIIPLLLLLLSSIIILETMQLMMICTSMMNKFSISIVEATMVKMKTTPTPMLGWVLQYLYFHV